MAYPNVSAAGGGFRPAPPLPAPAYSFLIAADEVPDSDRRWSAGIEEPGQAGLTKTLHLEGVAESSWGSDSTIAIRGATQTFASFVVRRKTREDTGTSWEDALTYARDGFAVWEHADVGREVWTGLRTGGKHLAESTGTTSLTAVTGIVKGVDSVIAALGLRPGQIHMTPIGLARYLDESPGGWERVAGKFYTYAGRHLLIADDGYLGTAPDGTGPASGHTWVYGSDPIRYRRDPEPEVLDTEATALSRDQNTYTVRIQRRYLLDSRWERRYAIDVTL